MSRKARAEMLIPGDIVRLYCAERESGQATIEEISSDEFTPDGEITFWTTEGRFNQAPDDMLTVLAWAPMTESDQRQ